MRFRRPILLFDGMCHLCQGSVRFILRHERDSDLLFAPLQSAAAAELLKQNGLAGDYSGSLVLIEEGKALLRSDAGLAIAARLKAPWSWAKVFRVLPRRWRDALYDAVAQRRYRWFGRDDQVNLPKTPDLQGRMLGEGTEIESES